MFGAPPGSDFPVNTGENINIAFNPTFLTDGLQAINAPFVHISFTGDKKPAVLTGKSEPGAMKEKKDTRLIQ